MSEIPQAASVLVSGTLLRSAVVIGSRGLNGADRGCTSPGLTYKIALYVDPGRSEVIRPIELLP